MTPLHCHFSRALSNPCVFGFVNDTERIPDYPHPAGTQTDLRIKMALWPGISSYEPHYISLLRCGPYANRGRLAWFCHNHKEQPLYSPRYYTYTNDWVKFNGALSVKFFMYIFILCSNPYFIHYHIHFYLAWIPEYLQAITKTILQSKMMKEPSAPDKPGYIYAFEIKGKYQVDLFLLPPIHLNLQVFP